MSVELIWTDLAAAGSGLERSRAETAAADHAAGRIAARAAGAGFTGIAASVSRVGMGIRDVGAGIDAVAGQVGEAVAATAATPGQATPQDAIASLVALVQKIERVQSGLGDVMRALDRAEQLTEAALRGGRPGPLRARLDGIRRTLVDVVAHLAEAKRRAAEAVAHARATGDAGICLRVTGPG